MMLNIVSRYDCMRASTTKSIIKPWIYFDPAAALDIQNFEENFF